MVLSQRLGRFADLALARQEHQHVAAPDAGQFVHRVDDAVHQRAVVGVILVPDRPVPELDRIEPARNLDDRRRPLGPAEVLREALGVDRRRRDDHLQVGPPRQQLPEVAEQEVDVQRPLVRLVDDQGVVRLQQRVALRLGEQDAVGHQLDRRAGPGVVGEAHLVADDLARRRAELLRNAAGDRGGGEAARLGVPDQAALAAADDEADLRQLGRLARARLAADDDDLVRFDRARDVLAATGDGQFLGKGDGRQRRTTTWGSRGPGRVVSAVRLHRRPRASAAWSCRCPAG